MKKNAFTLLLVFLFFKCSFGQITSDSKASNNLKWLIENPIVESDSVFTEKSVAIFKWQALNHQNSEMRIKGISEFMETSKNDKYFKRIIMIYSLSELDNQINTNLNENDSAYSAILSVLKYYNNLVELDSSYNNSILETYLNSSEKELKKKIKKL